MNSIKLPKVMPDGLFVQYFAVREVKFGDGTFEAVVGGWSNAISAFRNMHPELTLSVHLPYQDMATAADGLLEKLCLLDDWTGGELVDLEEELRAASYTGGTVEQAPEVL